MKRNETSAVVDGLLRLALMGGVMTVAVAAPNALRLLEKPLDISSRKLDKRMDEREIRRILRYMKYQGLLTGDYDFGLQITKKGQKRLLANGNGLDNLKIETQQEWDENWRIVFYDVPERLRSKRNGFICILRRLGFINLQRSVWVYPYPCRDEIELISVRLGIDKFITYIESAYIDNQSELLRRFRLI